MMPQGRILILEDREGWRKALAKALQARNFSVEVAEGPTEAAELLEKKFFHLLVLDISLDPNDDNNSDGLKFLEHLHAAGATTALSVIVLSGYLNLERAHNAVFDFGAVDFIEKRNFDNRRFAQRVQYLFASKLKINLNLDIHWQGVQDASEACGNLKLGGSRVKRDDPRLARVGAELDDLLCRLFHDADTVLVEPMRRGKSGSGVLRVQPFYSATGPGRTAVVKFGEVESIRREEENFRHYVKPFLGGGRSTNLDGIRQTPLLGGIRYSLLGEVDEEFEDFETFYHRHGLSEIRAVIENLFRKTCSPWYASAGTLQLLDLGEKYGSLLGLTAEKLEDPIRKGLKSVQGKDSIHFDSLASKRTFTNPVAMLGSRKFLCSTYTSITHGDLNSHNILVDQSGSTWLIDFGQTEPGHVLRDFALLDTSIRLILLTPEKATLEERLRLEEALLGVRRWSDATSAAARLEAENEDLAKCFATIRHLRRLAAEQVSRNPKSEMKEYWVALLYFTLNHVRFWDLPTVQREHALLSAALLAENITI